MPASARRNHERWSQGGGVPSAGCRRFTGGLYSSTFSSSALLKCSLPSPPKSGKPAWRSRSSATQQAQLQLDFFASLPSRCSRFHLPFSPSGSR
ncbi:hypothetical protein ACVXHB_03300 [Escherichia coli]